MNGGRCPTFDLSSEEEEAEQTAGVGVLVGRVTMVLNEGEENEERFEDITLGRAMRMIPGAVGGDGEDTVAPDSQEDSEESEELEEEAGGGTVD